MKCPDCKGTGYYDYAGFRMDVCECSKQRGQEIMSGLDTSLASVFRRIGRTVDISLQPNSLGGELWTIHANRGFGQGETLEAALANWAKDTATRND